MPVTTPALIGGEPVGLAERYENRDPATGAILSMVVRCRAPEVDRAVRSARAAWPGWRRLTPMDRSAKLVRLADVIELHAEELAVLETGDTGKPLSQSRTDAAICARYFRFYGHVIEGYRGTTIPLAGGYHAFTTREPFGVCGHVLAWNYPMQLFARGVAPALATGNCVVAKPADETPRTAVRLAELALQAGVPAGVLNVVPGIGVEAGAALTQHSDVDYISFVGSADVGRLIAQNAAERLVPAALELGGKSAHLVFGDADLADAAAVITRGILHNAGQTCSAGSRVVVHDSVHGDLVGLLQQSFSSATIGPGMSDPDVGPLVSMKQRQRVADFVVHRGTGDVLSGGHAPTDSSFDSGAYFLPTLIDNVDPQSAIAQEEVFGPVLCVTSFHDEPEALAIANGTPYGLMGAVWTNDLSRAHRVAASVHAGQVYVNSYGVAGGVELPFGGFKRSGYGREKGLDALDEFTATKTTVIRT